MDANTDSAPKKEVTMQRLSGTTINSIKTFLVLLALATFVQGQQIGKPPQPSNAPEFMNTAESKPEIRLLSRKVSDKVVQQTNPFSSKQVINHLDLPAMDLVVPASGQTTTTVPPQKDDYVFPSSQRRFHRYVKNTVGPFSLLKAAAGAGIDQWNDSPEEWQQGMEGYGKRFASSFGKNAIRQTVTYALSEAFRLDTGFEKSKHSRFLPRLGDALVQNVTSRTRSGKRVISVPIFAGAYSGSIIAAETWYPSRFNYKDGLRGGTYSLLAGFGINVVREFLFNW